MIAMARSLALDIIAEGVETREQLDLLSSLGCPEIQGYYFSCPLEAGDLEELARARQQSTPPAPQLVSLKRVAQENTE